MHQIRRGDGLRDRAPKGLDQDLIAQLIALHSGIKRCNLINKKQKHRFKVNLLYFCRDGIMISISLLSNN